MPSLFAFACEICVLFFLQWPHCSHSLHCSSGWELLHGAILSRPSESSRLAELMHKFYRWQFQGAATAMLPVSWLSFVLLVLTGAGLVFYYDREKKRHIEDIHNA